DRCVVMAVTYMHTETIRNIYLEDEIDPRWFDPGRLGEKIALAKAIAEHHSEGKVFPPFEVLVRWILPGGKPISRVKRLNSLIGAQCNSDPSKHRGAITNYAMDVAGSGAAITVTIRNSKRRHLIVDEFVVEAGVDPLMLRWMQPSV